MKLVVDGGDDLAAAHRAGLTRRELLRASAATGTLAALPPVLVACSRGSSRPSTDAPEFDSEVPQAWFQLMLKLVEETPGFSPPVASRAFGYAGVALYEALVPGMPDYRSLTTQLQGFDAPSAATNEDHDWPTVANAALAAATRGFFPTADPGNQAAVDDLESSLAERLGNGVPRAVASRSIERGADVTDAVVAWSEIDGGQGGYLDNFPAFTPPVGAGLWEPTAPAFAPPLQPYWGENRTFVLTGGDDCPSGDHPTYAEAPGSGFHDEAVEVYEAVRNLTDEQREIALFWADDPGTTPTPPGHSISILNQVLSNETANLALAAEAYARCGMAVADAFICCWATKYRYNLLRPITYIQELIDPSWGPPDDNPELPVTTPPFPEYTSGHSVQSAAAFGVLTELFGDEYRFVDHTHDERGLASRSFDSFLEAAEEAAISRLYGGIHFRSAIDLGVEQGRCVGEKASTLPLRA